MWIGARQRYTIGLTAYRIGVNYTNNLDFISIIEPELRSFAKQLGKTVFLVSARITRWYISVSPSRRIRLLPQQP